MLNSNTTIKRLIKYFIIRIVRSSTWKYPTMNLTEKDIILFFLFLVEENKYKNFINKLSNLW